MSLAWGRVWATSIHDITLSSFGIHCTNAQHGIQSPTKDSIEQRQPGQTRVIPNSSAHAVHTIPSSMSNYFQTE